MKFVPKETAENVNVAKNSLLLQCFVILVALVLIVGGAYFSLGYAVDIVADNASDEFEIEIAKVLPFSFKENPASYQNDQRKLQNIVDKLAAHLPPRKFNYTVSIVEEDTVNVLALPGGKIVVFTGFLKQVESENEITMVLGHELGHFVHRDHLRGLGRGLVAAFIQSIVSSDGIEGSLFGASLNAAQMTHSRGQEHAADIIGLELLNKVYGHVGGATDFFERMQKKELNIRVLNFFETHPMSEDRVAKLNKLIAERKYSLRETASF